MNIPFALRIGLAIFGVGGTLTISVSLIIYNQISGSIWNGMSSRLKDLNRLALSQIKVEQIETINKLKSIIQTEYPVSQDTLKNLKSGETISILPKEEVNQIQNREDFQDLVQYLRRVKYSTAQSVVPKDFLPQKPANKLDVPLVRYVYILTDIPGINDYKYLRFIADGDYEPLDLDDNGIIDNDELPSSLGQIYNAEGQIGVMDGFKGNVSSNPEYTMDQWGIWITSFGPILDENGKIIAILGIDMNAKGEFNLLRKLRIVIVIVIVLSVLLSLLAGYVISIYFNKPISALIKGVDAVSKENYDYHVDVNSKDELGILANTFNLMVDSVKDMKARLQEYTESLEEKVEKRTSELKQSLNEVHSLKVQQDGDYFLTSLLLEPLSKNTVNSDNIRVEFFLKQKKEFSFKNKILNLGGDINIAHSVIIENKNYIVFLNGDAMGKSIQGAGGALVLGSVFHSIIARLKLSPVEQSKSPERWLKDAFVEMHKVFEAFDGSMLMSSIIGLINDKTGTLYFVNAEHPNLILYRDNKATYIEPTVNLRKLGTEGIEGQVSISVINLEDKDSIFIGSDGKDDILLKNESNQRIINEDDSVILKILEQIDGNIENILDEIYKIGDIIDDLSIIKLTFNGKRPSNEFIYLLKEKALTFFHEKNYSKCIVILNQLFEYDPTDNELLYYGAYACKFSKNLSQAADWGERLYLRSPKNSNNLINLINVLLIQNNLTRADRLLERLGNIEHNKDKYNQLKFLFNKKAQKLKNS